MTTISTPNKKTICAKLADKQAIIDSMAPLAPYPTAKVTFSEQMRQHAIKFKSPKAKNKNRLN